MRSRQSRSAVEVFLFIISHFFNVVKPPNLHRRTHILFLNIISYFFIKIKRPHYFFSLDANAARTDGFRLRRS